MLSTALLCSALILLLLWNDSLPQIAQPSRRITTTTTDVVALSNGHHNHSHHNKINYSRCPNLLPELDELVQTEGFRLRIYITYHNAGGEEAIRNFSCNGARKWVIPVFCNTTKYFEFVAYRVALRNLTLTDLHEVDYIAMTGYKSIAPYEMFSRGSGLDFSLEDKYLHAVMLFAHKYHTLQVLPFSLDIYPIIKQFARSQGPHAIDALTSLCKSLKWPDRQIQNHLWTRNINRNTFIAKPDVFLKLVNVMNDAMDNIDHNPSLDQKFKYDANYQRVVKSIAMKLFGVPYYYLYGFVLERMPAMTFEHLHVNLSQTNFPDMMKLMKVHWPPPLPKHSVT